MSDAYIDEILSEVKVVTTPLLVTVDVISAENTVVSDDVVVMAETIDVEVLAQSNTFEMAADGAFNIVTINHGSSYHASYSVDNNQSLATIFANAKMVRSELLR